MMRKEKNVSQNMLIDRSREKLINAIIYFAKNTAACGKTKLFKLLYFLDFEHFRQTGRSVTGLKYFAWRMGPVPTALYDEIEVLSPDMADKIAFSTIVCKSGEMLKIKPLAKFDDSHFSKRELSLLEKLAKEFHKTLAEDMIEKTHLEHLPWHRVYHEEDKKQGFIPYEYALKPSQIKKIKDIIIENQEMHANYL
jgi:uncharacterized phage-associated protein